MNKEISQRRGKYKKVLNRSQRAEEYNHWTENIIEGLNNRLHDTIERFSEFKPREVKLNQSNWNDIKWDNIQIIGISKETREKKGMEDIFEETMA